MVLDEDIVGAVITGQIDAVKAWLRSKGFDRRRARVRRTLDVLLSPATQGSSPPPVAFRPRSRRAQEVESARPRLARHRVPRQPECSERSRLEHPLVLARLYVKDGIVFCIIR